MTYLSPADITRSKAPNCRLENLGIGEQPIHRRGTKRFEEHQQKLIDADNREFERRQRLKGKVEQETPQEEEREKKRYIGSRAKLLMNLSARIMGCSIVDIIAKCRVEKITLKRQMAMVVVCEQTTLSYTQIGKLFDRDHSTVMHARNKIFGDKKLREQYRDILDHVLFLESDLYDTTDNQYFSISAAGKMWVEGADTQEIAIVMDVPESAVYNKLTKIRAWTNHG